MHIFRWMQNRLNINYLLTSNCIIDCAGATYTSIGVIAPTENWKHKEGIYIYNWTHWKKKKGGKLWELIERLHLIAL